MRGRTEDKTIPKTRYAFMAVPPSQKTIGLFEWELPFLKKKAGELSLLFRAKPDAMFWDEISRVPLITQWNLDHDDCPFLLSKSLCTVHAQKPLICQAYPMMSFGILSADIGVPVTVGLADCPNTVSLPFAQGELMKIRYSDFFKELVPIYGSSFLGMLRLDGAGKLMRNCMENLEKEGIIRRAILGKQTLKSILRAKPIGFLEHLRKIRPDIEQTLLDNVKDIYALKLEDLERMIQS